MFHGGTPWCQNLLLDSHEGVVLGPHGHMLDMGEAELVGLVSHIQGRTAGIGNRIVTGGQETDGKIVQTTGGVEAHQRSGIGL